MSTFYISQYGADNHVGTIDSPFKSVKRAVEAIRELLKNVTANDKPEEVTVYLSAGVHSITETITIRSEDLNLDTCKITFKANAGEYAVISGGAKVTGWERDASN
ncbi:MAG: hypothetical protein H7X94_04190 [Vallitaleaceae bacterium]|nr:hypothetical protein [Vallitaleaceae bacterium]